MTAHYVTDELSFLTSLIPIARTRVLEIGCGDGEFSRRLLREGGAQSVVGLDTDSTHRATTLEAAPMLGLTLRHAGAEAIPLEDGSVDVAVMLKSLHHVPVPLLDAALMEVRRILSDRGHVYVSEPLYAGEFNEVMRLFHDEGTERAAAYAALRRAEQSGAWDPVCEVIFDTALEFHNFDHFMERMVGRAGLHIPVDILPAVRNRFEQSMHGTGARFVRQIRVNVLRKR